jgi:hypothetical protein
LRWTFRGNAETTDVPVVFAKAKNPGIELNAIAFLVENPSWVTLINRSTGAVSA